MISLLNDPNSTVNQIYKAYENKADSGFRDHLGASIIGRECERSIWYSFRWFAKSEFSGRMLRLFETGQLAEERLIENLQSIGVEAYGTDPETGDQFRVTAIDGHFGGSLDGCAYNIPESPKTWHVLEFKTHGDKSFTELNKLGVDKAKPEHYAQMMIYMGLTEMTRALYLAVNKNTDELYQERIKFDPVFFKALLGKAKRVIYAKNAPVGISDTETYFKCRFCPFNGVCHQGALPDMNCRTCKHSSPVEDGMWLCSKKKVFLTSEEQRKGCPDYETR